VISIPENLQPLAHLPDCRAPSASRCFGFSFFKWRCTLRVVNMNCTAPLILTHDPKLSEYEYSAAAKTLMSARYAINDWY